jgi:PIN domain nuclease of toxin-antitoxin system
VTSCVLDASAVLALGHREDGANVVAEHLEDAAISTVNWSEVLRRSREMGVVGSDLRATLVLAGVAFVPFDESDAETAATLCERTRRMGLSLADRACLALATRLGVPAVTADRAWANLDLGVEIVCIR